MGRRHQQVFIFLSTCLSVFKHTHTWVTSLQSSDPAARRNETLFSLKSHSSYVTFWLASRSPAPLRKKEGKRRKKGRRATQASKPTGALAFSSEEKVRSRWADGRRKSRASQRQRTPFVLLLLPRNYLSLRALLPSIHPSLCSLHIWFAPSLPTNGSLELS